MDRLRTIPENGTIMAILDTRAETFRDSLPSAHVKAVRILTQRWKQNLDPFGLSIFPINAYFEADPDEIFPVLRAVYTYGGKLETTLTLDEMEELGERLTDDELAEIENMVDEDTFCLSLGAGDVFDLEEDYQ
jgi:hypothetical protein